MDDNRISFMGNDAAIKEFILSSIKSCDIVIEHYDFVLNDISSDISNPKLEATKGPAIAFLRNTRNEWIYCRKDLQKKLREIDRRQ